MSPSESSPTDPHREEEEDQDLLTYGEVGARLHEELQAQRARVVELEATGGTESEVAKKRLAALEDAAERNRRQPINDENFEQFFGYKGRSTRNT